MSRRRWWAIAAVLALCAEARAGGQQLELSWPTPATGWSQRRPLETFVQPTASGDPVSGTFGSVRSSGTQFHEGLDLKPVGRNRQGEAGDPVFAVLPGIVRHIATRAGDSGYGRYVVLEHPEATPAVYSLYAHLAAIQPGLQRGARVTGGQVLGTMGRSAGGYTIPKERAHLHLEIGLMISEEFPSWYAARGFGSRNEHGLWNGMNLMGIDPLDFFRTYHGRSVDSYADYFSRLPAAVRLRIATRRIPDFTKRYPALVKDGSSELLAGWEVWFTSTGLPFRWSPVGIASVMGFRPNEVRILEVDEALLKTMRGRSLVVKRSGRTVPGRDLETVLQQLFGLP
jgi:murein DD-endopeptidase MepM/ murein hydrolase activator NlpD